MKKILFAAAAVSVFAAAPAFAQASNQVNINATVNKACGVGNHVSGPGTAEGFTAGDISITDLADGNGQFNTARTYTNRSFGNLGATPPRR